MCRSSLLFNQFEGVTGNAHICVAVEVHDFYRIVCLQLALSGYFSFRGPAWENRPQPSANYKCKEKPFCLGLPLMCVERKRANHTAGLADLSVVSSNCIYFSNSYKKGRTFKAVIPNCSQHKPQTAALCAGKCLEGWRREPSLRAVWMFYSCTYGLEVKVTSLEIPSIDGQAVLWLWRMTLACCPECCCGGRNVMMGDLHILTFQAWLSAPSPLFAHASCISGPPNADRQGWPAQRELPGAGEQHIPARPRCWVLPLTLWGSMGALGWDCADTRALFLVIQVVFVFYTLNFLKQLWKPQLRRLLYNYLTTNLIKALQLTGWIRAAHVLRGLIWRLCSS